MAIALDLPPTSKNRRTKAPKQQYLVYRIEGAAIWRARDDLNRSQTRVNQVFIILFKSLSQNILRCLPSYGKWHAALLSDRSPRRQGAGRKRELLLENRACRSRIREIGPAQNRSMHHESNPCGVQDGTRPALANRNPSDVNLFSGSRMQTGHQGLLPGGRILACLQEAVGSTD